MTADLTPAQTFRFDGETELTLTPHEVDGFRIQASPVARALGFREAFDLLRSIPESEKGSELVRTPGGEQVAGYLTEGGFYRALGQRQAARIADPEIRERVVRFQSWVFGEVLPAIRRTGSYSPAPVLTDDELIHRALEVSARRVAELTERVAVLEPQAQVATKLLDAEGDLSVRDAAQTLTRAGVKVGAGRLFNELEGRGWIKRAMGDGRYRVIQTAIETGYMSVLPQSHYHPKTGVLVLDPPQPRVTPKGLQRLLADYGAPS